MEVLLLKDVPHTGRGGDIKSVTDGYAKNYLIPMGLATRATPAAVRNAALQKEAAIRDRDAHLARMREHQKKLDSLEFRASLKTTEKKTYGSVTAHDIAAFLDVQGIPVEKSHIDLKHPIKSAGEHVVNIKLAPDIIGRLKVLVLSERE